MTTSLPPNKMLHTLFQTYIQKHNQYACQSEQYQVIFRRVGTYWQNHERIPDAELFDQTHTVVDRNTPMFHLLVLPKDYHYESGKTCRLHKSMIIR